MTTIDLLFLAIALSADAFAVSICKGVASKENYLKTGLVCGIWFGFFQALMPTLGWLLGVGVADYVEKYSSYIAFALLAFLGIKMIVEAIGEIREEKASDKECCSCCKENEKNSSLGFKVMIVFAIATSIDALAAGLSFAAMDAPILLAVTFIGITTFLFSFVGSAVGAKIGEKFKSKAEIAGGIILLAIGVKILVEHLITLF